MYRRNPCGTAKLPEQSKCYEIGNVPVFAYGPGVVAESSQPSKGGYIVIDHPLGWRSQYMHLIRRDVKAGERVTAGQRIGLVGYDTSPGGYKLNHLHFQLRYEGNLVDPGIYLRNAPILPWPSMLSGSAIIYVGILAVFVAGFWYFTGRRG
ncbi:MAG: M23 family metallopeptidase [Deltaproteobacteria bacterium]|nr:M23 family metallopeptidase [Deltaproteobacteria bacterium]